MIWIWNCNCSYENLCASSSTGWVSLNSVTEIQSPFRSGLQQVTNRLIPRTLPNNLPWFSNILTLKAHVNLSSKECCNYQSEFKWKFIYTGKTTVSFLRLRELCTFSTVKCLHEGYLGRSYQLPIHWNILLIRHYRQGNLLNTLISYNPIICHLGLFFTPNHGYKICM